MSVARKRGGFFLVLVLVVIAIATMAVYSFTELMIAYDDAAYLAGDRVQARVNVESGIDSIRLMLSQPPAMRLDYGGVYNNPSMFQAINVSLGADNVSPSNFSVIAPGLTETGMYGGIRFGLQNESARLNINTLIVLEQNSDLLMPALALTGADEDTLSSDELDTDNIAVSLLMALPGMTEDVADAILDWLDEDEDVRPYGAEAEYYTTLTTPYSPSNGSLQSVEELLLVRGVTPTLLFGADSNRNGVLDADEQQRFGVGVETPGALGWASYLTVYGAEGNKTRDGLPRVNVSQEDMETLYDELLDAIGDESYASFIVAYRIAGKSMVEAMADAAGGDGEDSGSPQPWSVDVMDQIDLSGGAGNPINQVLDVVGATVTIGNGDNAQTFASPFFEDPISMAIYLPILMDVIATQDVEALPGRINLNECPAELLYGIPTLEEETVQAILEARQTDSDDPNREFATWPLVEGILTIDQMRMLIPLLTGGGDVYRAQLIGYFEESGISSRSEVIIDATTVNPKVVSWKDLSHLGRGFELTVLGQRAMLDDNF
ncbi:type II secretion system minor pseudopilin [Novipirellula artificiosorum]|uniref:General secretion pathway protein K n=1 Tax=Novipirellula artificiosorum TaxID=2528016 RepID=A0A5C6E2R2_9BACT|nr:type II secretion system protein GspK [Novipirellula artificiosorum]TWU41901.1 General secretion pathway protein K [Novipirellula artificiosorum]